MVEKVTLIWSDFALEQIDEYARFLEEEKLNPAAAKKLVQAIFERADQLKTFPDSGSSEQLLNNHKHDYYFLPVSRYKIIFRRIDETTLFISDVFPCAVQPNKISLRTTE